MAKYLDKEFTDLAENEFKSKGIKLVLGEKVARFEGRMVKLEKVVTDKGSYEGDLVVLVLDLHQQLRLFKVS